jgi:quercetin dioxygenase-like cupin family protein
MRAKHVLAFAVAFAIAASVLAQASDSKMKSGGKMAAGKAPVFVPAADVKWTDLDAKNAPGVKIADMWGNHATGAYGSFIKFPAGFAAPLHTHPNEAKIIVISGTFVQAPEGKPEVRLGPGSYLLQPGAGYKHVTSCDKASDCVFFAQSNGKFAINVVEPPKAAAAAPAKK